MLHKKKDGEGDIEYEAEEDTEKADRKAEKVKEELKKCLAEKREYLEGWQRAKADFVNLKRSSEGERHALREHYAEEILSDILPALDSFDMAMKNVAVWNRVDENWRKGVEYIRSQLLSALLGHGLAPFDDLKMPFDPARHHSVGHISTSNEKEDHAVLEVIKRGYSIGERVIRPAEVRVGEYKKS